MNNRTETQNKRSVVKPGVPGYNKRNMGKKGDDSVMNPKTYRPLPVGVDSFEEVIEKGYYYVDKTLLIKELLDLKGKV